MVGTSIFAASTINHHGNTMFHDDNILNILARNYDNQNYDDYYEDDYSPKNQPPPRHHRQRNFDDDGYRTQPAPKYIPKQITSLLELLRNHKQLGASLLGLGLFLSFAGMMFFFEATLLRLGNLCIITGVPLLVGPDTLKQFFIQKSRIQATVLVSIGILLVFFGKPRIGILFEIFGLLNTLGFVNTLLLSF